MRSRGLSALCGIVAGGVGLAVAHVLAVFTRPDASPVSVVGESFIDVVPAWLKNVAVALFGLFDKAALLGGIAIALGLVLAVLGAQARRRPAITYVGLLVLAAIPAVLAVTRPGFESIDVVPSVVCGVVSCLAFAALFARMPSATTGSGTPSPTRRRFLTTLGITAAAAGVTAGGVQSIGGRPRQIADFRRGLTLPSPTEATPPLPAGIDPPVSGLTPYRTALEDFYRIDTALTVPRIDPAGWRLLVTGEVENELELTFDELIGGPLVEAWVTLTCVSNLVGGTLAGNAIWTGLPVRDVLARARPLPGADMVLSSSVDGWTASTPLEVLTDPGRAALFAVTMNGEPLPIEHGFPVRMVVPGLYGYVSATKWVTQLEVTRFSRRVAYWSTRGWSPYGPIKTASRIDVPQSRSRIEAGKVVVAGVAWAQHRGIAKVEVQVDDRPWAPAVLVPTAGPDTWVQWTYEWTARPGEHKLRVRATDGDGQLQTSEKAPPAPDGATGWHTVSVVVT